MNEKPAQPSPDLRSYDFGESVGYLLSRVKSLIWNMVTQRSLAELGITAQQSSLLFMVASGKCHLAAELAREYGIDASAVTRLVDRLEQRGLLKRVRSSEDRRVVRLAVTPEGLALAERMPPIFRGVAAELTNGLPDDEVAALKNTLRRILVNNGHRCPWKDESNDDDATPRPG